MAGLIYCASFITVFLVLGVLRAATDIPDNIFWVMYFLAVAVFIIAYFAIKVIWFKNLNDKLTALLPILRDERNPDKYIAEVEKLLSDKKSKLIHSVMLINLCAGYCAKKDFKTAKEKLEQVHIKKLTGLNRTIYYMNLAYVCYNLGQYSEGDRIAEDNKKDFDALRDNPGYGYFIVSLDIFSLMGQGKTDEAKTLVNETRGKWQRPEMEEELDRIEGILNSAESV